MGCCLSSAVISYYLSSCLSVDSSIVLIPNYFCIFPCRSVVYLEIDNRKCSESSGECFSNIDEAASFIAAAHIKDGLRYPLVSVNSSKL